VIGSRIERAGNVKDRASFFNIAKIIGFSLYFVILFAERTLALVFSVKGGGEYALTSGNPFNYIAYSVTAASLLAGTALFARLFVSLFRALRSGTGYDFRSHSREWVTAATVLLFGGMMHTGFTVAGVQFASYGFLIAALILSAVEGCLSGGDKYLHVVSAVYLVLFSMSIPVCYISFMDAPLRVAFFVAEFAAVFALVPIFGVMTDRLMRTGVTSFHPIFPAVMTLLSGATIALKWSESVNWFVLIFASATLLCYLSVGIVAYRREPVLTK